MLKRQERKTFQVRRDDMTTVTIQAQAVAIDGLEEYTFFVHTHIDGDPVWVCSEALTGAQVGEGLKWYDAATNAEIRIKEIGKEAFDRHVQVLISKIQNLSK